MAELDWDEDNEEHLLGHSITVQEVEDLFDGPVVPLGGGTDAPDRIRVLGRTAGGRYLSSLFSRKVTI